MKSLKEIKKKQQELQKPMIKLFVSDVDGTLLNDNHEITEENKKALLALKEAGIQLVLASGRTFDQLKSVMKDMDVSFYGITMNGGSIVDENGNTLLTNKITEKTLNTLFEVADKFTEVTKEYYCEKQCFTSVPYAILDETYIENYACMFSWTYEEAKAFHEELNVKNLFCFDCSKDEIFKAHPLKMEFHPRTKELRDAILKEIEMLEDIQISNSAPINIEIMHKEAGKGNLVKKYCELFNFKEEEVAVIGDNNNDVDMLSMFENSYVVENGSEKAKQAAKFKTKSNNESGFAIVVNKIIEENKGLL